jgi:hypothetical protein
LAAAGVAPGRKGREKLPENIKQLLASSNQSQYSDLWPRTILSRSGATSTLDDTDLDATIRAAGFSSLEALLQSTEHDIKDTSQRYSASNFQEPLMDSFWDPGPIFSTSNFSYNPQRVYSMTEDGVIVEILNAHEYVPRGPSVTFNKQTWWESLLPFYSADPYQASQKIFQDLNFLFVVIIVLMRVIDCVLQFKQLHPLAFVH